MDICLFFTVFELFKYKMSHFAKLDLDVKFNSILSIALIPQAVDLIVKNEGLDDISAMNKFYHSKTYEMLAKALRIENP